MSETVRDKTGMEVKTHGLTDTILETLRDLEAELGGIDGVCGFPAGAGIDHDQGRPAGGRVGFPRRRGDRPYSVWHDTPLVEVSPQARG